MKKYDIPPEVSLALSVSDMSLFGPLYDKYKGVVFAQCCSLLPNRSDAEELTNDVFIFLRKVLHQFEGRSDFKTWLYKIVRSRVLMKVRSTSYNLLVAHASDIHETRSLEDHRSDFRRIFDVIEIREIILGICERPDFQSILLLHYYYGMSIEELSDRFHVSKPAINSRLFRALHLARDRVSCLN